MYFMFCLSLLLSKLLLNRDGLFVYFICCLHSSVFLVQYIYRVAQRHLFKRNNTNLMHWISSTFRNIFCTCDFMGYNVVNSFIYWNNTVLIQQVSGTLGKIFCTCQWHLLNCLYPVFSPISFMTIPYNPQA